MQKNYNYAYSMQAQQQQQQQQQQHSYAGQYVPFVRRAVPSEDEEEEV